MSNKITLEEEKKMASWYDRLSQDQIRKRSGHGWTQVNRTLKAKNIAWLLYHEMQDHSLTKYANKHLQEVNKFQEKMFWLMTAVAIGILCTWAVSM